MSLPENRALELCGNKRQEMLRAANICIMRRSIIYNYTIIIIYSAAVQSLKDPNSPKNGRFPKLFGYLAEVFGCKIDPLQDLYPHRRA